MRLLTLSRILSACRGIACRKTLLFALIFRDTEPRKCSHGTGFLTLVFRLLRKMPQIELSIPHLSSTLRPYSYIYIYIIEKDLFTKFASHLAFCYSLLLLWRRMNVAMESAWTQLFHQNLSSSPGAETGTSDLAGSTADGTTASKAVEGGHRDCSGMRESWGKSWTAIKSVVWMAWRRGKSFTEEGM